MSWVSSDEPCECGHAERLHVGGQGRCPVWNKEGGCICPRFHAVQLLAAALVEALLDADYESIDRAHWREIVGGDEEASYDAYVATLLPVVRELMAEELEAAADDVRSIQGTGRPYDMADRVWRRLRDRARDLRAGRG